MKSSQLPKKNLNLKLNRHNIITIACAAVLVFAHIAILFIIAQTWKYYAIYPSLFASGVGIVICAMAIIDIIFFVGFNNSDLLLKIVSSVLAVFLLIGGTVGSYYINRANKIVNNIFDEKSDKYETFSGVFVCYDKYNTIHDVKDLSGKRVGLLQETSNGITYLAKEVLSDAKIDYAQVDYKTNTELMTALIDGKVDAIAITSAYRTIYGNKDESSVSVTEPGETTETEDTGEETSETSEGTETDTIQIDQGDVSPFAIYMDNLIDFNPFEKELKVEKTKSTKNIATEPFNVLLIGYSRTDIGSPIGLADSIIVATINPQTYTVSMTSIARDSFVPVACYGGEYDKINSGRSTSRACFIETVRDFIGMDIDYYMELDYLGLVQIVNSIGGITINNPVAFELDGIYVPAGDNVFADGQMALQFCRERHHMPGGDFDRQQHQKEVIIAIARKLIESGDLTVALNAMDAASEWMSTDFTLSQLTSVFNLLLNTKNFTGLDTFDLVDFQNTRMTGNGGVMYYSYDMRLPLWVYLVYKGSYEESMNHIHNVMGDWDSVTQTKNISFSLDKKYEREELISYDYDEEYMFTPDPMPPFWATLVGLSESQAKAWAAANGVSLDINYIYKGEPGFDANAAETVVDQSVRYGALVSEYPYGSITVMGPDVVDESKMVPDFREHNYMKALSWGDTYGVNVKIEWDPNASGKEGDVISQSPKPYTLIEDLTDNKVTIVVKAGVYEIKFDANGHGKAPDSIEVMTGDKAVQLRVLDNIDRDDSGNGYIFKGWFTDPVKEEEGMRVTWSNEVSGNIRLYAHWEKVHEHKFGEWKTDEGKEPTCTADGSESRVCQDKECGKTETRVIPALGHDWKETGKQDATCEADGYIDYICNRCGETDKKILTALGHDFTDWTVTKPAEVDIAGEETGTCSRCGKTTTREIPPLEPETPPEGEQNQDNAG